MTLRARFRRWLGIERDIERINARAEAMVLRLKPGDVLVMEVPRDFSHREAERIQELWKPVLERVGITAPIVVVQGRMRVLRPRARGVRRAAERAEVSHASAV
jgi:hypothetical protein